MTALHAALCGLLDAADAVLAAATPGPWYADGIFVHNGNSKQRAAMSDRPTKQNICKCQEVYMDRGEREGNAALIALSRNALPPLLAYLREQAEQAHREWCDCEALRTDETVQELALGEELSGVEGEETRALDDAIMSAAIAAAQLRALAAALLAACEHEPQLQAQCEALRTALQEAHNG